MFITTAFSLSVDVLVVPAQVSNHLPDLLSIRTYIFMDIDLFLFDEVDGVVSASSKEMTHLGLILASTQME